MLVTVDHIPAKNGFRRAACRVGDIENFLSSDCAYAEYVPDGCDTPRRAYNGLLMAVKRQYIDRVKVCWRQGRVFLKRLDAEAAGRQQTKYG